MVYDKIENIEFLKGLSEDINLGFEYLKNATLDTENGVHELSPRVKSIVSEYKTKEVNEYGFEAHKKLVPMQPGDVPTTYADATALERDFGFTPKITLREGLRKFAEWYKAYYD